MLASDSVILENRLRSGWEQNWFEDTIQFKKKKKGFLGLIPFGARQMSTDCPSFWPLVCSAAGRHGEGSGGAASLEQAVQ